MDTVENEIIEVKKIEKQLEFIANLWDDVTINDLLK